LHNSEIKRISRAKDYFQVLDVDRGASKHELEKAHRRCLIRIQFSHHGAGSDAIRVVEEAYVTLPDPARRDRYLLKAKVRWPGRSYPSNREEDYSVSRKIKKRLNA
jgi:curved DNA-binding protein CbpA